jgi:hypothetical protein
MSAYKRRRSTALRPALGHRAEERFVAGVDRIENAGVGSVRLVLYTIQTVNGQEVRIENDPPLVMPKAMIMDLAAKLISASGKPVMIDEGGKVILMN